MIDVNWDLAPEGAIGVAQRNTKLAFTDKDGNIFLDGHWGISSFWHVVSTRPTFAESITKTPSQPKTVADAVEYYDGVWPEKVSELHYMSWDSDKGIYTFAGCESTRNVCTRAEFEAYVKEQESEKWTHEYDNSNPRRLKIICDKPDVNGEIAVIVNGPKGAFYTKTLPSKIRLIKPTISKAEAWDKIYDAIHDCGDAEFSFNSIVEQYNII